MKIFIAPELKKIGKIFESNGFEAFLVGGAVRDSILEKTASDWDIATNAKPQDVMRIFKKTIPTGIAHGTVSILIFKKQIEVTTYRIDGKYDDFRHPSNVKFAAKIEDDLSRRDFTINAIAANLKTGKILDPFFGLDDIQKKIIRTVGSPFERFCEDGLRPVRALRFATQLDFSIEEKTFLAIQDKKIQEKIALVSKERFRDEFCKILLSNFPSKGIKMLADCGVLKIFCLELHNLKNSLAFENAIFACDVIFCDLILRLASLFCKIDENPKKSAEKTKKILFELKFSRVQCENVSHLIENSDFPIFDEWNSAKIRKFAAKFGAENIKNIFLLRRAIIFSDKTKSQNEKEIAQKKLDELQVEFEKILQKKCALSLKDLAINGDDLIREGFFEGRTLGKTLQKLLEVVLEDPSTNQKNTLIEIAKKICEKDFEKK